MVFWRQLADLMVALDFAAWAWQNCRLSCITQTRPPTMSFSHCGPIPSRTLGDRALRVHSLANAMLASYGLPDWSFRFNRRKTEMGLCLYSPKRIELSIYFIELNSLEAIRETLLHEIA